jgi:putative heme-binding domain-containing protein
MATASYATRMIRLTFLALAIYSGTLVAQQPPKQPDYTPTDIENGRQIYQANCSFCHGPEGDGVPGVNFGSGRFRRGSTDDQLVRIILGGIPGTAMPPSNFSEGQAGTIVAYVRSLALSGASGIPLGDAARGRSVFEGKGQCLTCHSVGGVGSRVGPNLTEIGALRRVSELQRSLIEPGVEVRADHRSVRAVTSDGTVISGRLLNQDSFTLQLLDSNERLVSLDKTTLREFAIQKTSSMPSYRETLSASEMADVLGYLVTLKGRS